MLRVAFVTGGRVVAALLQTVILLVLARSTSLTEFGLYSAGFAAGTTIGGVLNFGLTQWLLRIDPETGDRDVPVARGTAVALGLVAGILCIGVTIALGYADPAAALLPAVAAAANLLSDSVLGPNQSILFREGRVPRAVAQQLVVRTLPFAAVLVAVAAGLDPFLLLAAGYLIGAIGVVAVSGRMRISREGSLRVIRASVHFWRESIWSLVRGLDVVIVSLLLGPAPTAAYAAAARLASPIHIVTGSISVVFVPQLSAAEAGEPRRRDANRLLRVGLLYGLLVLLASPVAAWLGPLLLGEDYARLAILFPLAVAAAAFGVPAQLLTTVLFANGEARSVANTTRTSTVLGLAAIAVFAALQNLVVVAIAAIGMQLLLAALLGRRSLRAGYVGRP